MARKTRGGSAPVAKAPMDAYVGLLAIALLAQIAGAVFFYLDWQQYPANKPPEVPKAGISAPQQQPPPPAAQAGGAVGMAGQAGVAGQAGMAGQVGMAGQPGMVGMAGMAGMAGGPK